MRAEYRGEKDCLSLKGARISADSAAELCEVLAGQALYMYCLVYKAGIGVISDEEMEAQEGYSICLGPTSRKRRINAKTVDTHSNDLKFTHDFRM